MNHRSHSMYSVLPGGFYRFLCLLQCDYFMVCETIENHVNHDDVTRDDISISCLVFGIFCVLEILFLFMLLYVTQFINSC